MPAFTSATARRSRNSSWEQHSVNLKEGAELPEATEAEDTHEEPAQAKMKTEAVELKFRIDLTFLRSHNKVG